jgi:hypothetical protein
LNYINKTEGFKIMRDLKDVINKMLRVIPDKEVFLIKTLEKIKQDQIYRAPEDTVGWELVSEELQLIPLNSNSEYWKFRLFSIFSTMSIEDIKKELMVI